MSRKLPAAVLEAKGAFDKDPQRRRVDPVATGDLGNPPLYFTAAQKDLWNEVKAVIPPGLAKSPDRFHFEILIRLLDKYRSGDLKPTELGHLQTNLSKFGMSPADRARCAVPPAPDEKDEFSDF